MSYRKSGLQDNEVQKDTTFFEEIHSGVTMVSIPEIHVVDYSGQRSEATTSGKIPGKIAGRFL